MDDLSVRTLNAISEIDAAVWDACAGTDHPFTRHAFLNALETSGSVGEDSGWMPYHMVLEIGSDVLGVAPMYIKGHSQGEYVFDHSWAHAYERAGGRYYPKVQIAVPFTPVTGPRLLVPDGPHKADYQSALLIGARQITARNNLSSVHITFAETADIPLMEDAGYVIRKGEQFHWLNQSYADFDAFVAQLSSRKRKAIRKERAGALESGLKIEHFSGRDITEAHWDAFFAFYMDTGSRKWGQPYLTREFFSQLGQSMGDAVLLVMVSRDDKFIAGALNLIGGDCLYGRYWGCIEDHRYLHFEVCYYQAIDYAINHGLSRVEAGAQGPHKLARGYLPVQTYSAHWMADPGFQDAVKQFADAEGREVEAEIAYLGEHSPFRKT